MRKLLSLIGFLAASATFAQSPVSSVVALQHFVDNHKLAGAVALVAERDNQAHGAFKRRAYETYGH